MVPDEEEEVVKDEMDSLFEGMVLFDPSQIEIVADEHDRHQRPDPPIVASPTDASAAVASPSSSLPLDENLFSDLTLITPFQTLPAIQPPSDLPPAPPPPPPTPAATSSPTSTSVTSREVSPSSLYRQSSTRKKKKASLRIGYARDGSITDDQPPRTPPLLLSHLDSLATELELPRSSLSPSAETKSGEAAQKEEEEGADDDRGAAASSGRLSFAHSEPDSDQSATTETAVAVENGSDYVSEGFDPSKTSSSENGVAPYYNSTSTPTVPSGDIPRDEDGASSGYDSIELKLERVKAQIAEKLKHAEDRVTHVSLLRKECIRKRRKAAENVNLASAKYRELEKELEEACEAEDFETAERVSENLASAEKEKERLAIALRDSEADCDSVDSKMQEVLELQIAAEEECASLLEHFAADAENNADFALKNAEVESSKEMDKLLSTAEHLEVKKMELEIESHLIDEARVIMNNSIEHSIKDDKRERELLCKRKEMLAEELEKLLALVKEKEAEIAETDSNIEMIEKRIADVVSGFQEAHLSIDTKYDSLQSGLSQLESENEALARKRKEIEESLAQDEGYRTKIRELAQTSADEANIYQEVVKLRKSLVLFVLKSREDRVRLVKTEEKLSDDVQMLRQEVSAARASLQELSSTKSSIQQEIESLKQRLLFIDKRVPELEAEKKVAAAVRNFKEAARLATEAKSLSLEKEGVQVKVEQAMLELGKLEEEICSTVNRLQETEEQIVSKEKEVAIARFQSLLLIAGAATAERSAALELGDLEEADILRAEAEAAESEARKLQPLHNFKEEELVTLPEHFISMELISKLRGKQLAELAASAYGSAW